MALVIAMDKLLAQDKSFKKTVIRKDKIVIETQLLSLFWDIKSQFSLKSKKGFKFITLILVCCTFLKKIQKRFNMFDLFCFGENKTC